MKCFTGDYKMSNLSCKPKVSFTLPTPPLPFPPTIPPKKVQILTGGHKENMVLVIKTESFLQFRNPSEEGYLLHTTAKNC